MGGEKAKDKGILYLCSVEYVYLMVARKPCVAWCLCSYDKTIFVTIQTMLAILTVHGNT